MSDHMQTYRQHLSARHLSDALLMKYTSEAIEGKFSLYDDIQIEEAFEDLAQRLGYRVFRIVPEIAPTPEPAVQAAE